MTANQNTDRRINDDRRRNDGVNLRFLLGNGNRRTFRRKEDRSRLFLVDHYSPKFFMAIVGILFLNVIDALMTLYLIDHGASEINPIMAYYLKIGPYVFFAIKYTLTVIGLIFLLILRNLVFRNFRIGTSSLLYSMAWIYLAVIVWEIHLVYKVSI